MMKILVVHGPNLNLLGERQPEIYGTLTLQEVNEKLLAYAQDHSVELKIFQFNGEGELIHCLHEHRQWAQGIVFNPAAYTHYSFALRDAIAAIQVPTVEVHLSAIDQREDFRKHSVIAPVCLGQFYGLGVQSYVQGIEFLLKR